MAQRVERPRRARMTGFEVVSALAALLFLALLLEGAPQTSCGALAVNAGATERVLKLVDDAAAAAPALAAGHGPGGVLIVHQLGGFRPRGPEARSDGPR